MEQRLLDIRKQQRPDLAETATPDQENYESCVYEAIDSRIREYLRTLEKRDPQFAINGMRNVWIAKPNCKPVVIKSCPGVAAFAALTISTTSRTTA
jgi:hypothetical protein